MLLLIRTTTDDQKVLSKTLIGRRQKALHLKKSVRCISNIVWIQHRIIAFVVYFVNLYGIRLLFLKMKENLEDLFSYPIHVHFVSKNYIDRINECVIG